MSTEELDIRVRARSLIEHAVQPSRRFKDLEELGGISAGTWRTFWHRNTHPSAQMLESLAQAWPQYAFWLVTGITDPDGGHVAPPGSEPHLVENETAESAPATEYFLYQIAARKPPKPHRGSLDLSALDDLYWQQQVEDYMQEKARTKAGRGETRKSVDIFDLAELDKPKSEQEQTAFEDAEKELRLKQQLKKQTEDQAQASKVTRALAALRKRKAVAHQ